MSTISGKLENIKHPSHDNMYIYIKYYIDVIQGDVIQGGVDAEKLGVGETYLDELLIEVDKEIDVLTQFLDSNISTGVKDSIEKIIVEYWDKPWRKELLNKIKDDDTHGKLIKLKELRDLLENYREKSSELTRVRAPTPVGPATTYPVSRGLQLLTEKTGSTFPTGEDYSMRWMNDEKEQLAAEKAERERVAAEKAEKERAAAAKAERERVAAAEEQADSLNKRVADEKEKARQSVEQSKELLGELDSIAETMKHVPTSDPSQAPKSVKTSDMLRELDEMLNSSGGDGAGRAGGGGKSSKSKRKSSKKSKRRKSSKRKRSKRKSRRRR